MRHGGKFKDRVIKMVNSIPRGKVMSYGQVALYAGSPRAARLVGWILNSITDNSVPWWRVVNKDGVITIKGSRYDKNDQRQLLRLEGVEVNKNYKIAIDRYRHNP